MLARYTLNNVKVLISRALIDSVISHYEFFLIDNTLNEYYEIKEETKNLMIWSSLLYLSYLIYRIAWSVKKIQKVKIQTLQEPKPKNNAFIKMWYVW